MAYHRHIGIGMRCITHCDKKVYLSHHVYTLRVSRASSFCLYVAAEVLSFFKCFVLEHMPQQWALFPSYAASCFFIPWWSLLTGDIITQHGSRPRHQEQLYLSRWLCVSVFVCVYIAHMKGPLRVWAACHYTSAQTPHDHWQMVHRLCLYTHMYKCILEATADSSSSSPAHLHTFKLHTTQGATTSWIGGFDRHYIFLVNFVWLHLTQVILSFEWTKYEARKYAHWSNL